MSSLPSLRWTSVPIFLFIYELYVKRKLSKLNNFSTAYFLFSFCKSPRAVCPAIYPSECSSVSPSAIVNLPVRVAKNLQSAPVSQSACVSSNPSVCPAICQSFQQFSRLSSKLSVCLEICTWG